MRRLHPDRSLCEEPRDRESETPNAAYDGGKKSAPSTKSIEHKEEGFSKRLDHHWGGGEDEPFRTLSEEEGGGKNFNKKDSREKGAGSFLGVCSDLFSVRRFPPLLER